MSTPKVKLTALQRTFVAHLLERVAGDEDALEEVLFRYVAVLAHRTALCVALDEVAAELEEEIRNRYLPSRDMCPDEKRRFDLDMKLVNRAYALLAGKEAS